MLSFFKRPLFVAVLGFILIGCFIWFAGPYFAFADYRPLASQFARLLAIVCAVASWPIAALVKRLRASRTSNKLLTAMVEQSKNQDRPSAEVLQLRERFEEGVAMLKRNRRGAHSLYELPWYVIIGAPGSGKTTALLNSGLRFPVENAGRRVVRGVGGTRNCDWLFTEQAIFLDTAGRFTTQDSDASGDAAAWSEFLALLRKYRKSRPVNGVILAISAEDLMVQGEAGREAHIDAARRRLNELNRELRIQLPVYVFVTKCDLVAGFAEYFDDLPLEGRRQVWGTTFEYEQTVRGDAARAFEAEVDALVGRLNERVLERLEEDRDSRRRARIFAFPQQMAALRAPLLEFLGEVFTSTRFAQPILLRGVYFTSGTQEGTPIDRLLGVMGRRFALAPESVTPPAGRGKSYFIERLLKDVLLAEPGLAGVNRRVEIQKAGALLVAYAATLLVAVLAVVVLVVSYNRNRTYIDDVGAAAAGLETVPAGATSVDRVVPRLDAVRAVFDTANRYHDDRPWAMSWGLFQGASLGNAARDAYVRELDGALLPHVASRIRGRLQQYGAEPEKLYEYLKAYLMLGYPEHLDKAQLAFIADLEWEAVNASGDADTAAALSKHFRALLEYEDGLRRVDVDQALIAQARATIRRASIPNLIYRQIRLTYAADSARGVRLDLKAGVGAERVLRRKSGIPLSQPILSLYTPAVFNEITGREAADVVSRFAADQWVWGDEGVPPVSSARLSSEVAEVYETDYIAAWERIVKDIEPIRVGSIANASEALAILSAPTSPLRTLLKIVDENTYLVKPPDKDAEGKGIRDRLGDVFGRFKEAAGRPAAPPGTRVTAHFAPIHELVNGDGGDAPIDVLLEKLRQIQQKLDTVGSGVGDTDPSDAATINSIGELVSAVKRDAAGLPPAVRGVVIAIASAVASVTRSGANSTLDTRYREQVVRRCHTIIDERYPFDAGSKADVPLADFGRLFAYGGVFDTFFKDELERHVDTGRRPWSWRADASGVPVVRSTEMLRQFEAAERIREAFFRAGAQEPELRFRVTPTELDAAATRFVLEIDGQRFEYRHGPERSAQAVWPGPAPGGAAASFEDRTAARPNQVFDGPWAWFRLIDAADFRRESDVRFVLRVENGGHEAEVRLDAASIQNPYALGELQQFRCGSEA